MDDPLTRKAIVGEEIGLDFEPEDIHIMRLTEEEFDARIEEYVEIEEREAGLINAIEEKEMKKTTSNLLWFLIFFGFCSCPSLCDTIVWKSF